MEISFRTLEADLALVHLNGKLETKTSSQVQATLHQLIEEGMRKITVDLTNVPFIDSSGLAALVSALRLAREKDCQIVLRGIQPQAQTVFRLTMLDQIFSIEPAAQ